jgi:hypothetical protein
MDASQQIQSLYNLVEEHTMMFSLQVSRYHAESIELLRRWTDSRSLDFQKAHQPGLNEISFEAVEILKRARLNLHAAQQAIAQGEDYLRQTRSTMSTLEEVRSESLMLQQRASDYADRAAMAMQNAEYSADDAEQLIASLGTPPV